MRGTIDEEAILISTTSTASDGLGLVSGVGSARSDAQSRITYGDEVKDLKGQGDNDSDLHDERVSRSEAHLARESKKEENVPNGNLIGWCAYDLPRMCELLNLRVCDS